MICCQGVLKIREGLSGGSFQGNAAMIEHIHIYKIALQGEMVKPAHWPQTRDLFKHENILVQIGSPSGHSI